MRKKPRRQLKPKRVAKQKQRAKLFWTGRSQAVRLPKEFRFEGTSVLIRREGKRVILEPEDDWPEGFFESLRANAVPDFEIPERPGPESYERRVELVGDEIPAR